MSEQIVVTAAPHGGNGAAPLAQSGASSTPLTLHPDRFFDRRPGETRRVARATLRGDRAGSRCLPARPRRPGAARRRRAVPGADGAAASSRITTSSGCSTRRASRSRRSASRRATAPPVEPDPRASGGVFAEPLLPVPRHADRRLARPRAARRVRRPREARPARPADRIYDEIAEKLASPEFRPRALFERFNIEVLATTDAATDPLAHHRAIRDSGWTGGRVVPTFRPDAVFRIALPDLGATSSPRSSGARRADRALRGVRRRARRAARATSSRSAPPRPTTRCVEPWTETQRPEAMRGALPAGAPRRGDAGRPARRSRRTCSSRWRACRPRTGW